MNRARNFDPTTALGQVVDLFASKGYSETSMEDIVQTTGVSRYGLYGTFGNKRELFEQALEQYAEGMGKQGSPKDVVRFVRMALGSCDETRVWLDFARDLGYIDAQIHSQCDEGYREIGRMLTGLVKKWSGTS